MTETLHTTGIVEPITSAPEAMWASDMLESMPVALIVVDSDGLITLTNSSLRGLFGYDVGELEGQPIETLLPPDLAAGHGELRAAYFAVPSRRSMGAGRELHGVTKSGRRIAIEVGLSTLLLDGAVHAVASIVDVTSLRAEQEKVQMAIDASASGMVMVNASNEIVLVNRKVSMMFGHAEPDLIGQPIEVLIPERYRRRHGVYRNSYLTDPTQRPMGGGRPLHGMRADGTEFPVEIGLTPVEDNGAPMVLATIIDVTERVRAEESIKRQNADLLRLNDELAQFAYSASHDLKAPLTTLDGILACIGEDIADGDLETATANAERARSTSNRLAHLVEEILGFARAEHQLPEVRTVELRTLVEHKGVEAEGWFAARGVRLRNDVPADITITVDERRLGQIVANLLSNASKFCDQRTDDRWVAVDATLDDDELVMSVSDNGIGIPGELQHEVFDMFRRGTNHAEEGSGLGLALVKQHVDHVGGEVSMQSSDEGTTFSLRLPLTGTTTLTVGA